MYSWRHDVSVATDNPFRANLEKGRPAMGGHGLRLCVYQRWGGSVFSVGGSGCTIGCSSVCPLEIHEILEGH